MMMMIIFFGNLCIRRHLSILILQKSIIVVNFYVLMRSIVWTTRLSNQPLFFDKQQTTQTNEL